LRRQHAASRQWRGSSAKRPSCAPLRSADRCWVVMWDTMRQTASQMPGVQPPEPRGRVKFATALRLAIVAAARKLFDGGETCCPVHRKEVDKHDRNRG
jgi:hypothetical protein